MADRAISISIGAEHERLRSEVRTFCARKLTPILEEVEGDPDAAYASIRRLLGASRLLDEIVTAEFGGRHDRLDLRAICIVREELAAVSGLADLLFVMQGLGSFPLQLAGPDRLRKRWLPRVRTGKALAALALTEEHAGSDVGAVATSAEREGNFYVLTGEKWFISNAGVADFYCVFATTDPSKGKRGLTAFFVEARTPGLSCPVAMRSLAPHPLGVVRFDSCRIPVANRIGEEGAGFKIAMSTLDMFRASVGAAAIGMGRRALDEALEFVSKRSQFGKLLADFQLTQAALAEMAVELDAARLLVFRAASAHDSGAGPVTIEASMAKLYATEAAQRIVDRALQLHGGRGLLEGWPIESLYREVRALRIYEGTSEIQKLVIASQLLAPYR